jgi:YbgC/YbaW family acyl-CoA thioester hydrolase
MSDEAAKPCFTTSRRVEFHDTDMAGIVHFANFFRYMESAEHEFLRSIGHDVHRVDGGIASGWPRVSASCDYRRPARFGEVLVVRVFLDEIRRRSVRYRFEFDAPGGGPRVADGMITAACVRLDQLSGGIEAVAIPEELRRALENACG